MNTHFENAFVVLIICIVLWLFSVGGWWGTEIFTVHDGRPQGYFKLLENLANFTSSIIAIFATFFAIIASLATVVMFVRATYKFLQNKTPSHDCCGGEEY